MHYFLESASDIYFSRRLSSVTPVNVRHILPHSDSHPKLGRYSKIRDRNSEINFSEFSDKPAHEQKENRKMPMEVLFLVALWTLIPALILFFIVLGLSLFRVSLQIQVAVVIGGIVILSIRTFRLYRGVRTRMLAKVRTGPESLVGVIGIVTTDLRPKGEVRVNGEFWQAVAKEGWIEKDREVEVVGMEGLALNVRMVKEKA